MAVDAFLGRRLLSAVRLRRWELRIERAIGAAFDRRRVAVDRSLRLHVMTAAAVPPDAFGLDEWDGDVADEIEPVVAAVIDEMGNATMEFLSLPPAQRAQILGQIDLSTIASTFTERIKGLGALTADRLSAALSEGIGLGEGIDKLAARVEDVFSKSASSAATIARTETHGAVEYTSYTTAGDIHRNGFPLLKTWLATEDDRTREDHSDADGQQVDYDEPFDVGGEELAFPGDPDGSEGNVINCRCTALFEPADDSQGDGSDVEEVSAED